MRRKSASNVLSNNYGGYDVAHTYELQRRDNTNAAPLRESDTTKGARIEINQYGVSK